MKGLILCAIMFAAILIGLVAFHSMNSRYFDSNDFYFHFYKSRGECYTQHYTPEECAAYPPGFSSLAALFAGTQIGFILFCVFLIFFLIPCALLASGRSVYAPLIYFSSATPFLLLGSAIFAQALLIFVWVLALRHEKLGFWEVLAFGGLALLIHSTAVFVFAPIIMLRWWQKNITGLPKFPVIILTPVNLSWSIALKVLPLPFWGLALKLPMDKIIFLAYFFVAALIIDFRASLFIPVALALWLPEIIKAQKQIYQRALIMVCLAYTFMQFWLFFSSI